jgi:hypothetical protein
MPTALTLVTTSIQDEEVVSFCSHCARRAPAQVPNARVCKRCGFGVILEADVGLAPHEDEAFLVVDRAMCVGALSRHAEKLLEISETTAVNCHLSDLLSPAEVEPGNSRSLAMAIASAVHGEPGAQRLAVRPANMFGIHLKARLGSCGPHPAALIVFE